MQQKKLILFLTILFIASSLWLFHASNNFLDPKTGKGWWAAYFSDPSADSLDFAIKNQSKNSNFHWEIFENGKKMQEGEEKIKKGESKEVDVQEGSFSGKIIIRVKLNNKTKEIYKNI